MWILLRVWVQSTDVVNGLCTGRWLQNECGYAAVYGLRSLWDICARIMSSQSMDVMGSAVMGSVEGT